MEGLLSFLIIGGLLFLMMRFGCGAHLAHGGHGGHDRDADSKTNHTDPVCGKEVDINQGYGKMHEGQLYRFCSRDCLDRFEAEPDKYLNQPVKSTGGEL